MKRIYSFVVLALALLTPLSAQNANADRELAFDNYHYYSGEAQKAGNEKKTEAIGRFRTYYAANPYRGSTLKLSQTVPQLLEKLNDQGIFTDLTATEKKVMDGKDQQAIGLFLTDAMNRVWKIAEEFRSRRMSVEKDKGVFDKLQKALLYYGDIEASRSNKVHRFHASCFAIPTAGVNIYFIFLQQMDEAESGECADKQLIAACDMLKVLGLQAWTQPLRNDETDKNVVQTERFRNHVWWVGGNALAYRSLLPVAMMYRSAPMVDLLSEVAQQGIGSTSQNTYQTAFWTEGCTADGAGWGHGKQCLVWGYPIDGNIYALELLSTLKGSPWEKKLSPDNVETLLNFFRGSNWYYYKGYILPYLDRGTALYEPETKPIRTLSMVDKLLKDWSDSFTPSQLDELERFRQEARKRVIDMDKEPDGVYQGTRWFFNNDDLIKKNKRYHILVNMASVRCDGLESAVDMADEYNFYPTDGMTLFQKNGNEYKTVIGAWDVTATPGVTAREGMDKLLPVTNWRGYCSKHNYAAAATLGGENAVAGYIFEKMNASAKEEVNDRGNSQEQNARLYGVKAYKSYFMLGDYMIALGAGITNLNPGLEGTIRTTIDQTGREGDLYFWQKGKRISVGSDSGRQPLLSKAGLKWLVQEGKFAYAVLPEFTKNAYWISETLNTDWVKRHQGNRAKKNLPAQVDVLRLWVDHSATPVNDTYGYVVYAGEGNPSAEQPFEVLRNDTLVQAVASKDRKVVEAVFYQPGATLEKGKLKLSVSAPCAVLVEEKNGRYDLSVTDAEMNPQLAEIAVTFNGKRVVVPMPQGALCGKPAVVRNIFR